MVFAVAFWPSREGMPGAFHGRPNGTSREAREESISLAFPPHSLGSNGSAPDRLDYMRGKDSFPRGPGSGLSRATGKTFERSKGARGR